MSDGSLTGVIGILSVFMLVIANGFFVASEFSLVAVRRSRVAQLVAAGRMNARALQRAIARLDYNLAACQLGITISSLALGWIGEPALAKLIEPLLAGPLGNSAALGAHAVAIATAFSIITVLHIVLGELAPKSLALQRSETIALLVVRPLMAFGFIFKPVILSLNGLGNSILRLAGLRPASEQETVHSPEEIGLLVAEAEKAGRFARAQRDVVERVINLRHREVSDIMTPRTNVDWADAKDSPDEILRAVRECRHEHVILSRGNLDEVVGVIRKQDLLDQALDGKSLDPFTVLQQPLVLPESTRLLPAIERFKSRPARVGVIVDEYGTVVGIVTRTDLLEAIAGDLPDVGEEPEVIEQDDGTLVIDGSMAADEAFMRLNMVQRPNGEFHTIAGFAIAVLGKIPVVGDQFSWEGLRFRVADMAGPRIKKILVRRMGG
jgi:putative hemolysin